MDALKERELFEESGVGSAILRLALPTVAGQVVLVIYNLADTFFLGLTGSEAMLTAATVCLPAFMVLSALSNLFGIGGGSAISRALGRGERSRACRAASFSFWGCAAATAAYALAVFLLLDPLIDLMGGTDPVVHAYCRQYLICTVTLGGLTTSGGMLLAHLVRAEGSALAASVGIALGGLANIALDPLFMFVLLPAGNEVLGAALATALSNAAAALYFLLVIRAGRVGETCVTLRPMRGALSDGIPREILFAGLPAFLMTLMENISFAVLDKLMSAGGTSMQAGIGVAKKVNMLAHCIVRGIAQGALPLIAYSYASGRYRRMRQAVAMAGTLAVSAALLCTGACLLAGRELVGVFLSEASPALAQGTRFLRVLCLGGPFSAFAYTVISFFQATGHGGKSFLLAMLRKGALDIPAMLLLTAVLPVQAAVWATPLADMLCCMAAAGLLNAFLGQHAEKAKITACALTAQRVS